MPHPFEILDPPDCERRGSAQYAKRYKSNGNHAKHAYQIFVNAAGVYGPEEIEAFPPESNMPTKPEQPR